MALQHLRSSTADKRPTPAAMSDGQLAMNTNLASPGLFFKDSNGDLVKTGPVHVGTTAPNATPASGGQAGNSKGELWLDTTGSDYTLKTWDGSAWREIVVTSAMIKDGTIVNADINASAAIVDTKLATIATAGKVSNSATTATNANTASAIVARDGSGNFIAGTITAALTGAASGNVLKAGDTMTGVLAVTAGTAALPAITPSGDPNTGIFSPGADQLAISTNGTGRLFVDATGKVTINQATTDVPSINIESDNDGRNRTILRFTDTDTAVAAGQSLGLIQFYGFDASGAGAGIKSTIGAYSESANGDSYVSISTSTSAANNQERLRIDSSGRLGLGTSSPAVPLTVFASTNGAPAASGTTQTHGAFRISAGNTSGCLDFGPNGSTPWIQATDRTDLSAKYDLLLNPNGGRVGIGITAPSELLSLNSSPSNAAVSIRTGGASFNSVVKFNADDTNYAGIGLENTALVMRCSNSSTPTERARIDSSGRLLVGTSTAYGSYRFQVEGNSTASTGAASVYLRRGLSSAGVVAGGGTGLGLFDFGTNDGTTAGRIECLTDATWSGTSSTPGRLVFSTTADGASSPTERLRITNAGVLQVADAGNISVGTTTGTKIGTATTQKLGFYNATPVVQPTAVADATDAASVITQLNALLTRMRNLGLIAT